jgi:SAM-dependent methyltransferase
VSGSLRDAWDAAADEWIAFARTPDHDHWWWRMTLPALLELLPAPGRLTVDLGCGEGRLARELLARGHAVVGIEGSPRLAEAARTAQPPVDARVGDAAAVPLADGSADLVVASMTIMNFDDPAAAVAEVARVLALGGRFVLALVHPHNSLLAAREHLGPAVAYVDDVRYAWDGTRDGVPMTFHDTHRPLSHLFGALEAAGLLVEAVREPVPTAEHLAAHPKAAARLRDPILLLVRAVKPGA